MKKLLDVTATVVTVLTIVLAFLLVGVRLFGITPYTVLSGSMEPHFHVGSLIYVRPTSAAELKVGDPITYTTESGIVVTHRIVEILADEDNPTLVEYRVKGDANDEADGTPIPISAVIGKPIFHIPLLGYLAFVLHTPVGILAAASIIFALILLTFLPDIIRGFLGKED